MTTDTAILDALRTLIGDAAYEAAARMNAQRTRTPLDYEDEATLARSRGGLSRWARTEQRRNPIPRIDEYGYDQSGRYYVDRDGAA